ncbi:Sm-like ribonucleo protein [Suhomyces tanzawaensis NRRL Y-17324]|uniref:Sm-like ribonucleo protein n=1 Tax=Suhomyces tanzawaensis NRRL Y-17324 TaxID=984487 RepID=A0A1E4SJ94_9ASCO|nr:Sm-like ribonucleo protein [Suhomyces tanzawaensis NRRL Y-17324]ODV79560.1 Sm-like ribonucleo protein [Suhomyces tanzawaensis NRRL Y-17324]
MKLVRFLMSLPGATNQPVTVELKNGTSVNGQILSSTPLMNLSLKNVKLIQPHQDPQLLQFINIRGNQIRQILLPDDLNIDSVLAKSVTKIKGNGAGPGSQDLLSGAPKRGGRPMRGGRGGRGRGRAF